MIGLGEILSIASALVWAVAVILFRMAGASLGPFALNLFKNALALVLLSITLLLWPGAEMPDAPPLAWALMLISGIIGIGIGDTLYLGALNRIGASRLAVVGMLYSPFVILLSMVFLAERLLGWQWAGLALVLGGVAMVNRPDRRELQKVSADWGGVLLGTAAVGAMAGGVVMAKPLLEVHDFLWVVTARLVGGTGYQLGVVAVRGRWESLWAEYRAASHWPQIIAGSVCATYLAMMLWLGGYKYTSASVAAILNETAAIFILILAALFLHDRLRMMQWAGAVLAMLGVVLVVMPE